MFRGSAQAKIDDRGRLKVPTVFRVELEKTYGSEVFITSLVGESALLYPLAAWEEIEARLAALPATNRSKERFLERVNYYGMQGGLDSQGRVLIPQILRSCADLNSEVVVSARLDHLEIWDHERFQKKLVDEPFTEDDFRALDELGI